MIFQIRTRSSVNFEPIALTDIAINLFVFFFLTFGLLANFNSDQKAQLPVELPRGGDQASRKVEAGELAPLTLTVDRRGKLFVGKTLVTFSKLAQTIDEALKGRREKSVSIRPHKTVTLETFVPVLDVVRHSKARSVSIETESLTS